MQPLSTNRRYAATLVLCGLSGTLMWMLGQDLQRGPVRSPHGPLTIPCGNCHTSVSWSPLRAVPEFNHNRETRYPLQGLHKTVECRPCHANLVFRQASVQCAACHADLHRRQFGAQCETCHRADYITDKTINHRAAGFPIACGQCHGADIWLSVNMNGFNHSSFGFALVGAHATLPCVACHVNNQFLGIPADCYSCHVKDYTSAKNPDHLAAGFPTTCSVCHDSSSWLDSTFNHASVGFALTGAHISTPCAQCHLNGQFARSE